MRQRLAGRTNEIRQGSRWKVHVRPIVPPSLATDPAQPASASPPFTTASCACQVKFETPPLVTPTVDNVHIDQPSLCYHPICYLYTVLKSCLPSCYNKLLKVPLVRPPNPIHHLPLLLDSCPHIDQLLHILYKISKDLCRHHFMRRLPQNMYFTQQ